MGILSDPEDFTTGTVICGSPKQAIYVIDCPHRARKISLGEQVTLILSHPEDVTTAKVISHHRRNRYTIVCPHFRKPTPQAPEGCPQELYVTTENCQHLKDGSS